jgi:hypothetical protein
VDCRGLRRTGVAFGIRLHELLTGERFTLLLYADDAGQPAGLAAAVPPPTGDLDVVLVLAPGTGLPEELADHPARLYLGEERVHP